LRLSRNRILHKKIIAKPYYRGFLSFKKNYFWVTGQPEAQLIKKTDKPETFGYKTLKIWGESLGFLFFPAFEFSENIY